MNKIDHTQTTVLITGGTQGLGFAVAKEMASAGCRQFVLAGRSIEKGGHSTSPTGSRGGKRSLPFL